MSTFVLPTFVADGSLGPSHIPTFVANGAITGYTQFPGYTFGFNAFTFIPAYLASPAFLSFTPSGGVLVGGYADIFGDPFRPTGGMNAAGTAPVVFNFGIAPVGGILVSGSSPLIYSPAVVPVGGMKAGGAGVVSALLVSVYDIRTLDAEPSAGIFFSGSAIIGESITWPPTGGVLVGGAAVVQEAINFIPSGGVAVSGAASVAVVFAPPVSGGIVVAGSPVVVAKYTVVPVNGVVIGGSAVVSSRQSLYVPSGGTIMAGTALAYMLPAHATVTTENPYADPFPGWSVNFDTHAASRYLGLPANSIVRFGGRTFVANAGGVYKVGADDDAGMPINASIEFATTDFQDSHEKRMEVAYVGVKTTGRMKMKVRVPGKAPQYYVLMPSSSSPKGTRVPIGKGLVGRYWGSRLDNIDGADFELESVEFNPIAGQRHGA